MSRTKEVIALIGRVNNKKQNYCKQKTNSYKYVNVKKTDLFDRKLKSH